MILLLLSGVRSAGRCQLAMDCGDDLLITKTRQGSILVLLTGHIKLKMANTAASKRKASSPLISGHLLSSPSHIVHDQANQFLNVWSIVLAVLAWVFSRIFSQNESCHGITSSGTRRRQ